jgi:DNA invertase Pin-like site-specific DNA recombinase
MTSTTAKTTEQPAGVRWGYGRVSTLDQNPDSQSDALDAAGIVPGRMFIEKASTRLAVRPKLEELRKLLGPGDVIVVTKADRIARSTLDLLQIVASFDAAGVKLEILTGAFNRDDPWGKALFGIQAVFAELERDLIHMRTMEGLEAARSRGRTGGRKAKLTDAQAAEVRRLYDARVHTVKEIGALFGITRETVYDYVRRTPEPAARKRTTAATRTRASK